MSLEARQLINDELLTGAQILGAGRTLGFTDDETIAAKKANQRRAQRERYEQQVREINARVPHPPGPLPPYPPRDADGQVIPNHAPPLPDPLPHLPLPQTPPTIFGPDTSPLPKEPGLPSSSSIPHVDAPTQQQIDTWIEPNPENIWGSAAPAAQETMEHRQFAPNPRDAASAAEPEVTIQDADANDLRRQKWQAVDQAPTPANQNVNIEKPQIWETYHSQEDWARKRKS